MFGIWFVGSGDRKHGAGWVLDEKNNPRSWKNAAEAAQWLVDGEVPADQFSVLALPEEPFQEPAEPDEVEPAKQVEVEPVVVDLKPAEVKPTKVEFKE